MFNKSLVSVLAIVSTSLIFSANAAPILGLDMDPSTPGIQSSLSVTEGASLTFDLVAFDDGFAVTPISVDTVNVDLGISSPGLVSFGGATAGVFAGSMGPVIDIYGTVFPPIAGPGSVLTAAPFGPGSIGLHGYSSFPFGTPAFLTSAPGLFDVLMSFSFDAITAGVTSFSILGDPAGSELFYAGAPPLIPSGTPGSLFPTLLAGSLTITSITPPPPPPTGVPEPSTITLLVLGLVGMMRKKLRLS